MQVCRVFGEMGYVRPEGYKYRSRFGMRGLSDPDGMARLAGGCPGSIRVWLRSSSKRGSMMVEVHTPGDRLECLSALRLSGAGLRRVGLVGLGVRVEVRLRWWMMLKIVRAWSLSPRRRG